VMHGETRFKDPLMPLLFILAAVGLYHISHKIRLLKNGK
jgi:hypothetical protein